MNKTRKTFSYCVLCLFFLIFAGKSQAQQFIPTFRIGLNTAQVNGDGMGGFHKAGIVTGFRIEYPFNKKWHGGFELLWSQKGSKQQTAIDNYDTFAAWYNLRLNYIEIPVLVMYNFNEKFSIQGGLGWGYMFSSKYEPLYGGTSTAGFIRKSEISATIGGEYKFADRWSIYARYTNSILPVNNNGRLSGYAYYGAGLINLVASFGLYYHFILQE
jgi:hypothetical protein